MLSLATAQPRCCRALGLPPPAAVAAARRHAAALPFRIAGRAAAAPRMPQRPQRRGAVGVCRAAAAQVDVESARKMLDGQCFVVDIRPASEHEAGRITKPPRKSVHIPFSAGQDGGSFVAQVAAKYPSTATKLIVMCSDGGADSEQAAELLEAAGYSQVLQMEGGFAGYTEVWSPSGKRRPPAGRWVSTGKEALKSGLNIPGVAESYDEGGNLITARYAKGLRPGETLPE